MLFWPIHFYNNNLYNSETKYFMSMILKEKQKMNEMKHLTSSFWSCIYHVNHAIYYSYIYLFIYSILYGVLFLFTQIQTEKTQNSDY